VLSYDELVDAVEREAAAIADALGAGEAGAVVPTCPDWDVHALARHLGEFTALWTHVVCEATGRPKTTYEPVPPQDPALLARWYRGLAHDLVGVLRATTAEQAAWTWVPSQQRVGFIARRCADELAMHRYDAQTTRGTAAPIDAGLAAECVLEVPLLLEGWGAEGGGGRAEDDRRSVHLCPTDSPHELTLTMAGDGLDLTSGHIDHTDLVLRGTTSDLALVAFDRPPLEPVERDGDDSALDAWYRAFHFG
jgi:uncharacterized protein (TIGR03083 family)